MPRRALALVGASAALLLVAMLASPAPAAPAPGLVESWPDSGSTDLWGGGAVYANPGHGGAGGASDGYLKITTTLAGNLGTRSNGTTYVGDWLAAGITHVYLWLDDVGNPDPLEIHFLVGSNNNRWSFNAGFVPPNNQWALYTVDLTDSSNWTQTVVPPGGGSFALALQHVDVVNVRHDHAPFLQNPDDLAGDFGLDELTLSALTGITPHPAWAKPAPLVLHAPAPNPARAPLAFSFETFTDEPVRAQVVDARGTIVRTAALGTEPSGLHTWAWDGVDDTGRRAAAGVYRVRITAPSGGMSRPFVLLR